MSRSQAADALGAHQATVRRIESATTSLDEGQVQTLLRAYGTAPAEIDEFLKDLATANLPGWWHPWRAVMEPWQQALMGVESAAGLIRIWEPAVVPTLLRTPAYARAVDDIRRSHLPRQDREARTELTRERQRRLRQAHTRIWALMSAAALLTPVGGPRVMAEQRRALAAAVRRGDVTLQIHPLDGPLHVLAGQPALMLYRVDVPEIPDHVVRDGGLPGTAEISNEAATVTSYHMLFDHACLVAPHPDTSMELLT